MRSFFVSLFTRILLPRCKAPSYVAFGFVYVQQLPHLLIECRIHPGQAVSQILMYSGFGYTEAVCCGTNRSLVFNYICCQIAGALFNICSHLHHSYRVNVYDRSGPAITL